MLRGVSEVSILSGRLVKRSLPSLKPGLGIELPPLKRLELAQGELAQIHDSDPGIHYIAVLELLEGSVRGNHYHTAKVEHMYVMCGRIEWIVEDRDSRDRKGMTMESGDLVVIQPGLAHAFRVLQPGVAIEFSPTRFNPGDIHPYPLI
jgi:mannose-6-phosphate isomerase-like protein (cupin superfamily)